MATLWKCDNGTYDVVDGCDEEGCANITHMNVPEQVLAAAPELLAALEEIVARYPDLIYPAATFDAIAKARGE